MGKVSWEYWLENWPEPQWRSAILIVPSSRGVLAGMVRKPDGVNKLEDGSIGADSESRVRAATRGEAGTEAKKPQSMAKVAPKRGHSIPLALSDDGQDRMSRGLGTALTVQVPQQFKMFGYPTLGSQQVARAANLDQ